MNKLYLIETIRRVVAEEIFRPTLCPIDFQWIQDHYDEKTWGSFDSRLRFEKLSKCLCLNGEIIGCYLLGKGSLIEQLKVLQYWIKDGLYTDLKFFVNRNTLRKYLGKKGIFSNFLFINKKHRNNNYSKNLIDYADSIGDYTWGISVKGKTDEFWLKQGRIKICEYTDDRGRVLVFTATKL